MISKIRKQKQVIVKKVLKLDAYGLWKYLNKMKIVRQLVSWMQTLVKVYIAQQIT